MSFYNGILNLTNWGGNVILPTLAGLFIAIAIIQFSKGSAYQHAMYGGLPCKQQCRKSRGTRNTTSTTACFAPMPIGPCCWR